MTTRLALVALVSFSFLTALAQSVFGQQVPTNCGPFMGWGWHGWFLGPLMMLAVLAAAFAVVVLIVRALLGSQGGPPYRPPGTYNSPLDILRERFAKGEIDKDEFEERRRVLGA